MTTRKRQTATKAKTMRKAATTDEAKERPPLFFPLGTPGLRRKGGEVDDEWLADLKGKKAAKVYREMGDNHPIIGAALWVIELTNERTHKQPLTTFTS